MIELSKISTKAPGDMSKSELKEKTKDIAKEISELAYIMHAQKKYSLLIIFQGMDSSGKDGATRKIFKYCSPIGLKAVSYKKPTEAEFAQDFLWRVHKHTPAKGEICIFNRSHYEDVLIQRVHKWIDEEHVSKRIDAINAFEESLIFDNNTTILKFYMHLSNERQKEKLQERLDMPRKNWKHNPSDWEERRHWDAYMKCYEDAINRSTVPWIIAPVDSRSYRDYFIASKVLETLKTFDLKFPGLRTE